MWIRSLFALALPFKGRVGWGWCPDLVIPAEAGIHFALVFGVLARTDSRPCVFRRPSMVAGHFLLLAQKKVTQEKGTLASAVCRASLPGKLRKDSEGFAGSTSVCSRRSGRHPAGHRFAAFPPSPCRGREGTQKSRARQSLPQKRRIYPTRRFFSFLLCSSGSL